MKLRGILALALLLLFSITGYAQLASPFSNSVWPAQVFTASGVTGSTIQLNGLVVSSTVGSSFASGTITLTGTSLTTVTFSVQGSADNGATFYPLPIYTQASPATAPTTTITATANGVYQVSLAGITHVKFVTSGTFTATNVSLVLSASPNVGVAKGGGGGSNGNATSIGGVTVASAPAFYGQSLQNNGAGSIGPSFGTAALQAPGVINFGDSITCGYGLANYTADGTPNGAYSWLLGSILGGTQANYCHSGWTVNDEFMLRMLVSLVPEPTLQPATTIMLGTNDEAQYGYGAGQILNYIAQMDAMGAYATIPQPQKIMVGTGCTNSGTWNTNVQGNVTGFSSTTSGATASCSITTYGNPLLLAYRVVDSNSGGTFTVSIDGVNQGTLVSTGFSGATITSGSGTAQTEFLASYPVTAGTHTVLITSTVTAGAMDADWIASANLTPPVVSAPRVFIAGPPPQGGGLNSTGLALYYAAAQTVVSNLTSYGLLAAFVPTNNYVNTGNDFSSAGTVVCDDGTSGAGGTAVPIHPNYCGQKHLLEAFNSVIQPIYFGGSSSGNATSIQGVAVASTTPTNGQVLQYNSGASQYQPVTFSGGGSTFTTPLAVSAAVPSDIRGYSNVNSAGNASNTTLDQGLVVYVGGGLGFGMDLGYINGGFATRLFAPNTGASGIAFCFHNVLGGGSAYPASQAQMNSSCPVIVQSNGTTLINNISMTSAATPTGACTGPAFNINTAGLQVCKAGTWTSY